MGAAAKTSLSAFTPALLSLESAILDVLCLHPLCHSVLATGRNFGMSCCSKLLHSLLYGFIGKIQALLPCQVTPSVSSTAPSKSHSVSSFGAQQDAAPLLEQSSLQAQQQALLLASKVGSSFPPVSTGLSAAEEAAAQTDIWDESLPLSASTNVGSPMAHFRPQFVADESSAAIKDASIVNRYCLCTLCQPCKRVVSIPQLVWDFCTCPTFVLTCRKPNDGRKLHTVLTDAKTRLSREDADVKDDMNTVPEAVSEPVTFSRAADTTAESLIRYVLLIDSNCAALHMICNACLSELDVVSSHICCELKTSAEARPPASCSSFQVY